MPDVVPGAHAAVDADLFGYRNLPEHDESALLDEVRAWLDKHLAPIADDYWARAEFPHELIPGLAELDIMGLALDLDGRQARCRLSRDRRRRHADEATTARRDGDEWVVDGAKRWIGNGTFADLVIVWARDLADDEVKGFVVEGALAKSFCTTRLRESVAWGRELMGGNGVVLDYGMARYFNDAEALYSYEGTREINTLIVGRAITGESAFT